MKKQISDNDLSYLVSNFDIEAKFKGQYIKVMTYPHLKEYHSVEELLPEDKSACFILIKTSFQAGHWTCLVRDYNNVYYFDSYGVKPDGELKNINEYLRYELGEDHRFLTNLLETSRFNIKYNTFQFQSYHENINTCGKWCTVFTKSVMEGLTLKAFVAGIKNLKIIYEKEHPGEDYVFDRIASMLYTTY